MTPIPVDLTSMYCAATLLQFCFLFSYLVATPLAAPALTLNSIDLPVIPLSAIVPERTNIGRVAGRPPRIPRGESDIRQKGNSSITEEQQETNILAKEMHVTSKRRIKVKQAIIEDNVEVQIEQKTEPISNVIKQVHATPLRGRKKKINNMPQLEPSSSFVREDEIMPKKLRNGRNRNKNEEEEVRETRTNSLRSRNKQQLEKMIVPKEEVPKKPFRSRKLLESVINSEEVKKNNILFVYPFVLLLDSFNI